MKRGAVAKKTTADATSSPLPFACMGVRLAMRLMNERAARSPRSIMPGATQFTETSGASAFAIAFVSMCSAAFEEQ